MTVGHLALLHACTLEDGSFVGMKACVMDGAVVETGGMVAAGALVTPGKRVRKGELWAGSPARLMRALSAGGNRDRSAGPSSTMWSGRTAIARSVEPRSA